MHIKCLVPRHQIQFLTYCHAALQSLCLKSCSLRFHVGLRLPLSHMHGFRWEEERS